MNGGNLSKKYMKLVNVGATNICQSANSPNRILTEVDQLVEGKITEEVRLGFHNNDLARSIQNYDVLMPMHCLAFQKFLAEA